jgi:hypothetical protein
MLVRNQPRQAQEEKEKPAAPAAPAGGASAGDPQDFYATYAIRDPQKKLEALQKFVARFPRSSVIAQARRELFKATVKRWPGDKKKIMDAASSMINPSDAEAAKIANIPEYHFIARELLSAGVLFDEAERFALKSLEFNKRQFAESLEKKYAEWKRPAPSDQVIDREYLKERVAYETTLGRIYLHTDRTAQGEKILGEAYNTFPTFSPAAFGLAELAEKRKDYTTAADYLTTATLAAGYEIEKVRSRFDGLYRKTHNGSLDGIEEALDTRYRKLFPNPIKVEAYKPSAARSGRVVLAEYFTGAG